MVGDGLAFIVRESVVSGSQEESLRRIPGWEAKQTCSPSQQRPAPPDFVPTRSNSRASSSSTEEDEGSRAIESVFCMQEPLVWASPEDTQVECNDSYNPAFESDRSRSLSPHRDLDAFHDFWGSRLVTQSQTQVEKAALNFTGIVTAMTDVTKRYAGISSGSYTKRNEDNAVAREEGNDALEVVEAGLGLGSRRVHEYVQNQKASKGKPRSEPLTSGDSHKRLKQTWSTEVQPSYSQSQAVPNRFGGEKDVCSIEMDPIAGHPPKYTDIIRRLGTSKLQAVQQIGLVSDMKISGIGAAKRQQATTNDFGQRNLEMPSTWTRFGVNASSSGNENARNQTVEEGHPAFHKLTQKLRQANSGQVHEKVTREASNSTFEESDSLFKGQIGQTMERGGESKCSLTLSKSMGNVNTPAQTHEKETIMIFSESVMDVVVQISGTLPTCDPSDPDLLSVVMSMGVSLPLPARDCFGRLIW